MNQPTFEELLAENSRLKARVADLEKTQSRSHSGDAVADDTSSSKTISSPIHALPFTVGATLSNSQIYRYGRQIILPDIGIEAQSRISRSSVCFLKIPSALVVLSRHSLQVLEWFPSTQVLIIGCGGLGSPCALYLAAAGIGRLGLVDHDTVELGNLHRQIVHTERAAAESVLKAESARDSLVSGSKNVCKFLYCLFWFRFEFSC
jgi:adenylyltransferase/sulfurtransferase